jgi:hypothetical protein
MVALLTVLAFSGLATVAAQAASEAPRWSIGGKILEEGNTHYITAKVYNVTGFFKGFTLTVGEGTSTKLVRCESARLKEGVLLGSSEGNLGTSNEVIEFFEGCVVTGNGGNCRVVEPIITTKIKSKLVESEKAEPANKKGSLLTEFVPEHGSKLATLRFESTSSKEPCILTETEVEGKMAGQVFTDPNNGELGELVQLPNEKKEAKSWLISFPTTPIRKITLITKGEPSEEKFELKAFSETATIKGTALILLAKKNAKGEVESEEVDWSPLP